MTKRILLATTLIAFTFLGCSKVVDSKPSAEETIKATSKAVKVTEKVTDKTATKASAELVLPQSSLKDQVVEEVVEVADEKTDGTATKIIESVK